MKDAKDDYDLIADKYDSLYNDNLSKAEDSVIYGMVLDALEGRVLDIGCSTGNVLDHVPLEPCSYVGVDVSQRMIDIARKRHPGHEFVCQNFTHYEDSRFDTALSLWGVANYFPFLSDYFHRVRMTLRPGGKYLGLMYSQKHMDSPRYTFNQTGITPPDVILYAPSTIVRTMEEAGFTDVRLTGFSMRTGERLPKLLLKTVLKGTVLPPWLRQGEYYIIRGTKNGQSLHR